LVNQQRIVKLISVARHISLAPIACVGQQAVGEKVLPAIRRLVRLDGGLDQGQAQHVILHIVAVLAVIQQADTVIAFGKIHPLMAQGFEASVVPTGVPMGRPFDIPKLDIVGSSGGAQIDREGDLQQHLLLLPVDPRAEIDTRRAAIDRNTLCDE
jgi:hypothetical protein